MERASGSAQGNGTARDQRRSDRAQTGSGSSSEDESAQSGGAAARDEAAEDDASAAPEEQPAAEDQSSTVDPARGARLNDQGFALMSRGDFAGAVPLLEQAVASWPEDSRELTYAYALFNLGKSLNRSGRAEEAIPYLEKRLTWDDQRETVQAELDLARRTAAAG